MTSSIEQGLTRRDFAKAGAVVGIGAGLLGTGFLSGCGAGGTSTSTSPSATSIAAVKRGGVLQVATDRLIQGDNLNVLTNLHDGVDMLQGMIREGLVTYDFSFNIIPRLAASWDVAPDFSEYTFHLRPNVMWHDGKPFTARDAAWSIERILDSSNGSTMFVRLTTFLDSSGVKVVDDLTLKLKLKRPDSLLLVALSNQQCYLTQAGTKDFEAGIGTGPFRLKSWVPGSSFEVEKNRSYWQSGEPFLDGVRGIGIAEMSTLVQSVASGDSSVGEMSNQALPAVKQNPAVKITQAEKMIYYNAVMDVTAKPFDDPRLREAMKRSLDRETLMRVSYASPDLAFAAPDAPVAVGDPCMDARLETRLKMDRKAAQRLMTEAGYPNGIEVEFPMSSDEIHASFGLGFAAALEGSMFRIKLRQISDATYWDTVYRKTSFFQGDCNRRHPVEGMDMIFRSGSPFNECKWSSPEMDALLNKAHASSGEELVSSARDALLLASKNSGEIIPAYRNRLWLSKVGVQVIPSTYSMLDFRKSGFIS